MSFDLQQSNNGMAINKRLTLTKIIKIDLSKENDDNDDESTVEYSPAYIFATNTSTLNCGTASQGVQFQFFGMFVVFNHYYFHKSN
jgi:hypothetical protein